MEKQKLPFWFKVLNLDEKEFERSQYADPHNPDRFRLKDLNLLRKLGPNIYESAAGEVKEYNDYVAEAGMGFKKYKLGKKIGSIPMWDAALHPELMHDKKAQEKYWQDNPEFKIK